MTKTWTTPFAWSRWKVEGFGSPRTRDPEDEELLDVEAELRYMEFEADAALEIEAGAAAVLVV